MYPLFELSGFSTLSEEAQLAVLQALVDVLTRVNLIWLQSNSAPPLYALNPHYAIKPRPFAIDSWQDIATTIARRTGDCKDFAAYRCAELLHAHIPARIRPFKVGVALWDWNGKARTGRAGVGCQLGVRNAVADHPRSWLALFGS